MTRTAAIVAFGLLAGCASDDVLDHIEDRSWDAAAAKVSDFCARQFGDELWWQRTRIEARREIRQRGTHGPAGPAYVPGLLDDKTAHGKGPVLMIWCADERTGDGAAYPVPQAVWKGMVRTWRD
jgi:hypothetical protein